MKILTRNFLHKGYSVNLNNDTDDFSLNLFIFAHVHYLAVKVASGKNHDIVFNRESYGLWENLIDHWFQLENYFF